MCLCVWGLDYLVDLIYDSEGAAVELLQGHEVQYCGDTALSSALMVGRQLMERTAVVKLHPNANPILVILLLQWTGSSQFIQLNNLIGPNQHYIKLYRRQTGLLDITLQVVS